MRKPNLGILIKPASHDCNMACGYCYYRPVGDLYPDEPRHRITPEIFAAACEQYRALEPRNIKIGWQGGEPTLMGLPFFREAMEVETRHARPGDCWGNSLQTNGALLDDEWCRFLAQNHFLVGISVDGPPQLNDMRKTHDGRPTWETAMRGVELLKEHEVEFNILTVISRANCSHAREVFNFLVENDLHFAQFIPCTEPTGQKRGVNQHSVSAAQYGDFMVELFDAWVENDDPSFYVRRFDNWLHLFFGLAPECCEYRQDCSNLITIEWNGDVYPCDFFVEERYRMGNVMQQTLEQMLKGAAFREFVRAAEAVPEACDGCQWLEFCHAGCFRHRQKLHIDIQEQPYLCEAKKRIFSHVFPKLMDLMKNRGRNPRLHDFLNQTARRVALGRAGPPRAGPQGGRAAPGATAPPAGRNAACPCGSGKKFKHCCGARTGVCG